MSLRVRQDGTSFLTDTKAIQRNGSGLVGRSCEQHATSKVDRILERRPRVVLRRLPHESVRRLRAQHVLREQMHASPVAPRAVPLQTDRRLNIPTQNQHVRARPRAPPIPSRFPDSPTASAESSSRGSSESQARRAPPRRARIARRRPRTGTAKVIHASGNNMMSPTQPE